MHNCSVQLVNVESAQKYAAVNYDWLTSIFVVFDFYYL